MFTVPCTLLFNLDDLEILFFSQDIIIWVPWIPQVQSIGLPVNVIILSLSRGCPEYSLGQGCELQSFVSTAGPSAVQSFPPFAGDG